MQITSDAARDVRDFYPQHPVPAPVTRHGGQAGPRDLLVLSINATGINMIDSGLRESPPVRDDGPQSPSAQLSCRERTGLTRMAVVTAVYDAAPAARLTFCPPTPANAAPAGPGRKPSTGRSTSSAACGRLLHGRLRDVPVSKNSTVTRPRPPINRVAASNCHARDDTGS